MGGGQLLRVGLLTQTLRIVLAQEGAEFAELTLHGGALGFVGGLLALQGGELRRIDYCGGWERGTLIGERALGATATSNGAGTCWS
jgi:hypothetical protein